MINNFDERYMNMSKSDIMSQDITNNITKKLWEQSDYGTMFYLGVISSLKSLAIACKNNCYIDREACLNMISLYKQYNVPDEIKELIDTIFEEFDYKEN